MNESYVKLQVLLETVKKSWSYLRNHMGDWVAKVMIYVGCVFGILATIFVYMEARHIKMNLDELDKDGIYMFVMSIYIILGGILILYRKLLDTKNKKAFIFLGQIILFMMAGFSIVGIFEINYHFSVFIKSLMLLYLIWFAIFETKTAFLLVKKKLYSTIQNPQDRLSLIITISIGVITALTLLK
ncbi:MULTISPECIES: hypothetical protein [Listeria]|uniref:hypothetical protein n=1 Tax=Listeria TaxID=1637 RepID=UPI000B5903AE|nr:MULTISPECIES: hypothetical protein [Listeria]